MVNESSRSPRTSYSPHTCRSQRASRSLRALRSPRGVRAVQWCSILMESQRCHSVLCNLNRCTHARAILPSPSKCTSLYSNDIFEVTMKGCTAGADVGHENVVALLYDDGLQSIPTSLWCPPRCFGRKYGPQCKIFGWIKIRILRLYLL